jgi:hypothetical protein
VVPFLARTSLNLYQAFFSFGTVLSERHYWGTTSMLIPFSCALSFLLIQCILESNNTRSTINPSTSTPIPSPLQARPPSPPQHPSPTVEWASH